MSSTLDMSDYIQGISSIVLTGIVTYPFVSFITGKFIRNRWLQRILFIVLILAGFMIYNKVYQDSLYLILAGTLFISFVLFHLIVDPLRKMSKEWKIILEIILASLLLLLPMFVVAFAGDFRIGIKIIEKFPNGGYSFEPGNWDYMYRTAILFSIFIIFSKDVFSYRMNKLEEKKRAKLKEAHLQRELVQTQLEALHAKVNPHFLYNSLNSIAGLALVDGEKTRRMALALSRFFRYSMNREQTNLIAFSEDIEMTKTYLEIEKIRFEDQLNFRINVDDDSKTALVPRMLLQPLAENCIKHGWKDNLTPLFIEINSSITGNKLILSVKDNGSPFSNEFIPGYGIKSTYDKLELLFPHRYTVEIIKEPEKEICITIDIV